MWCVANKAMLELLWERRVYHNLLSERWLPGQRVFVPDACAIEPFCHVLEGSMLPRAMGSFSYSRTEFESTIRVGRYSSLASGIRWMGADHPHDRASTSPAFYDMNWLGIAAYRKIHGVTAPPIPFQAQPLGVTIGNDVWIGDDAMLAPNITIGDGAIIGARALVLKDVPPYAIVVGQPARVLRLRFSEDLAARYLALQWWRFAPDVLQPLPVDQPERFADALEERIAKDPPPEFRPAPLLAEEILAVADPDYVKSLRS